MPAGALKASWIVTAAVVPGHEIKELTKVWQYTAEDFEKDQRGSEAARGNWTAHFGESQFTRMRREANEYAQKLQDPSQLNVVNLQFMWM